MSACTCPCPTCGTSDLTTLRAEVEALRDGVPERFEGTGWQPHEYRMVTEAYEEVLDLIDKHAREGQ